MLENGADKSDVADEQIFISYRRSDSASAAILLRRALESRFGEMHVFTDVTGIAMGDGIPATLSRELERSTVVLVVIGPGWLGAADGYGRRRIDSPDDWVRHEIETALRDPRKLTIPVLVDGASMPPREALPPGIEGLAHLNAALVRTEHFERDIEPIIEAVARALNLRPKRPTPITAPDDIPVGFFSYARFDEGHHGGLLTDTRSFLEGDVRSLTGTDFALFLDTDTVKPGQQWKRLIEEAIDASFVFVPVITPHFFRSKWCRTELERFLAVERRLGRDDLIVPIYLTRVKDLDDATGNDPVVEAVRNHQYVDIRAWRYSDKVSPDLKRALSPASEQISEILDDMG